MSHMISQNVLLPYFLGHPWTISLYLHIIYVVIVTHQITKPDHALPLYIRLHSD